MVDAISLTFGGKDRIFHFNNYALFELGKILECNPVHSHVELMNLASDNLMSAMAALLHAGFIGYEKSQFILKPTITIQEVAKIVGEMENLDEFTPAWDSFVKANKITEFLEEQEKIRLEKIAELEKSGQEIPEDLKKKIQGFHSEAS